MIEKAQERECHRRVGLQVGHVADIVVAKIIVYEAQLVTLMRAVGRLPRLSSAAMRGRVARCNGITPDCR
jgi:hypothetical protein